jgi:hypothetical protein
VPFFRYSQKNASITPSSPAEGGAGITIAVSFWAFQAEGNLSRWLFNLHCDTLMDLILF